MGRYLAVSIPFVGVVLFFLQSYYLRTSRQVRLLDIEAKAPIYTHFLESIQGISSIKAFNWGPQLREKSHFLLNRSQRPVYMLYSIQQWLILVLDLVVGAIAVTLIAMITSLRYQFNGASIGVALNILLTLNQTLANALKMWTMTEISVGAVSRVQRFIEDTPSEERCVASQIPPQIPHGWPCSGAVEFTDVTAGYEYVLSHLRGSSFCYVQLKLSQRQPLDHSSPQKPYNEHQAGRENCRLRTIWEWKDITYYGDIENA